MCVLSILFTLLSFYDYSVLFLMILRAALFIAKPLFLADGRKENM